MKRKTAKEILADSFRELAETKSVNKITIREIADNCGYSPATFYRQFRDKYDLIAWDYSMHCRAIMDPIGSTGKTWEQAMLEGCEYLYGERNYIRNLLEHTSGHDSFVRYMALINTELLSDAAQRKSGCRELDHELMLMIRMYCYGTVELICEWLNGSLDMTTEQLSALFQRTLPDPLSPYLRSQ